MKAPRFPSTIYQSDFLQFKEKPSHSHESEIKNLQQYRGDKVKVILVQVNGIWSTNASAKTADKQTRNIDLREVKTEDLDTYNSDCDDISTAKWYLMANIPHYGSDSFVVPHSKTNLNNMENQDVQAMHDFGQTPAVDFTDNEIHSDSNIIPSREKMIDSQMDDMIREKLALKEQVDSLEQNLSEQIKEKELHMLTKPQAFYDNIHKQALGYQNPFHLKKAQRIKPTLYDGIVMSDKHVVMPMIDDEETLIMEEESRSKMYEKAKDPEVINKNISHKPIDYEKLNRLIGDFGKRFTPQQELSAEQAFWLRMSDPTRKHYDALPVKIEAPKELPKISLVNESLKKLKFHLAKFDNVVKIRTTPNARTEGLKCSTSKCISKPTGNKRNDRILQTPSRNMKNKKSLFDDVHDKCLLDFVKTVNSHAKTGRTFIIVGNSCPLTRITTANVVSPKNITSHSVETQKPELKVYSRKPKNVKNVGSSKKAKIVESKNANHSEPNHTCGPNARDIPSSSSLVMIVRFGNDNIARIMGYGDYQLGNVTISRVYYVEGLGYNLTKDEAPEAIIKCIKNIQVHLNATVRNVRTDNGTEFVNQTLREFYENVSITHQTSVARTPQQNGIVERQN
ncbi:retrovirus-related pol polyprotein from transposon TNT 1-94 [Tanacetum coccineum]